MLWCGWLVVGLLPGAAAFFEAFADLELDCQGTGPLLNILYVVFPMWHAPSRTCYWLLRHEQATSGDPETLADMPRNCDRSYYPSPYSGYNLYDYYGRPGAIRDDAVWTMVKAKAEAENLYPIATGLVETKQDGEDVQYVSFRRSSVKDDYNESRLYYDYCAGPPLNVCPCDTTTFPQLPDREATLNDPSLGPEFTAQMVILNSTSWTWGKPTDVMDAATFGRQGYYLCEISHVDDNPLADTFVDNTTGKCDMESWRRLNGRLLSHSRSGSN